MAKPGRGASAAAGGTRRDEARARREHASGAGQNEVQDEAEGNSNDNLTDAPRQVIDQAAYGEFKKGFSNCLIHGQAILSRAPVAAPALRIFQDDHEAGCAQSVPTFGEGSCKPSRAILASAPDHGR